MKLIKTFLNFKNEKKYFLKPLAISCSGPAIGILVFWLSSFNLIIVHTVAPYLCFGILMLFLPISCTAYGTMRYDPTKHRSSKDISGLRWKFMISVGLISLFVLLAMLFICSDDFATEPKFMVRLIIGSVATVITTIVSYFSYN